MDTLFEEREQEVAFREELWNSLMNSKAINLFWKDDKRRFLGANRQFLKTYGFKDVSEILGKTDEDMHWHINDEPFREAEEEILEKGTVSINKPGKNIIKGIAHNILATKEPIYKDGKIIGLYGYFINMDHYQEELGSTEVKKLVDPVTGLMSSRGIGDAMQEYAEGWEKRGVDFAVIQVIIPEYSSALARRGETAGNAVLKEISKILVEETRNQASCARMFAGNFVLFARFSDRWDIRNLVKHIEARLDQVSHRSPSPEMLRAEIFIHYASDVGNIRELIGLSEPEES